MGSAGAGASSVFIRAAIASGFGRRLRRAGRLLRAASLAASALVVCSAVPALSAPVASSRSGRWRRASAFTPELATPRRQLPLRDAATGEGGEATSASTETGEADVDG